MAVSIIIHDLCVHNILYTCTWVSAQSLSPYFIQVQHNQRKGLWCLYIVLQVLAREASKKYTVKRGNLGRRESQTSKQRLFCNVHQSPRIRNKCKIVTAKPSRREPGCVPNYSLVPNIYPALPQLCMYENRIEMSYTRPTGNDDFLSSEVQVLVVHPANVKMNMRTCTTHLNRSLIAACVPTSLPHPGLET